MVGNFENRTVISGIFSQFYAAFAQKPRMPLPVKFLTQNLKGGAENARVENAGL